MTPENSSAGERDSLAGAIGALSIPASPNRLLTDKEVAAWLNIKPQTLRAWRLKGVGIPFVRIGSLIRYEPDDVLAYLRDRKVSSTTQEAAA